jgi:predicted ATPase
LRWWVWVAVISGLIMITSAAWWLGATDLDRADKISSVISMLFGAVGIGLSIFAAAHAAKTSVRPISNTADRRSEAGPQSSRTIPEQLPSDIADFTGRSASLASLEGSLLDQCGAVAVSAVAGKAGIGKTTLAVHAAHRVAGEFDEGRLYANLRGALDKRLEPMDILGSFLRSLGTPAALVPVSISEREQRFRELTAGRRILIFLDNAFDIEQIRPLIPGVPPATVLITSRRPIAAIPGIRSLTLDVFTIEECVALLQKIMGPQRVAAEMAAAEEISAMCGQLPLALRIVGSRLRIKPHWTLRNMRDRLIDETGRLSELALEDLEVRASLTISYRELPASTAKAFRLLSLIPSDDFPVWVAAAVLNLSEPEALIMVEELVDAQLLDVSNSGAAASLRYVFHDLIRLYGRERAQNLDTKLERDQALRRLSNRYMAAAEHAARQMGEGLDDDY